MNKYELLYIVPTQYTDAEVGEIQTRVAGLLEKAGATILRQEMVGKIKLAYPIKKARHGSYVLAYFDAPSSIVKDFNRQMELMDEVIRHTILARPAGAESKKIELTAYVPPLSEEGKRVETKPREKTAREGEVAIVDRDEANLSIETLDKKMNEALEGTNQAE